MKLLSIGFGSFLASERIISVLAPDSAPIKRLIQDSRENGQLIDASFGRSTKSVVIMDNGVVILSSRGSEELSQELLEH